MSRKKGEKIIWSIKGYIVIVYVSLCLWKTSCPEFTSNQLHYLISSTILSPLTFGDYVFAFEQALSLISSSFTSLQLWKEQYALSQLQENEFTMNAMICN